MTLEERLVLFLMLTTKKAHPYFRLREEDNLYSGSVNYQNKSLASSKKT